MANDGHALSWEKVALRLRSVSATVAGAAVVTARIVVVDGEPRYLARPSVDQIEPRSEADRFLDMLSGDDYGANTRAALDY